MPNPFQSYSFDDLLSLVKEFKDDSIDASIEFDRGNHWQNNLAWIGPRPPADAVAGAATAFYESIRRDLVSKNIVREAVRRDRNGVIGREPNWTVTVVRELKEGEEANEIESALMSEAESLLLGWWDSRRKGRKAALSTLQKATDSMDLTGRGPMRFFLPPALTGKDGSLPQMDIKTALGKLYLTTGDYDQTGIITDENTQTDAGIHYTKKDGKVRLELSFLNDEGETVIRIIEQEGEGKNAKITDSEPFVLSGYLTIYEMSREPLITEQVKQNQRLFNMTATMRTRSVALAGFPERNVLGGKRPSHFIDDPDNPGKQIEIFDSFKTGLGATNFIAPETVEDPATGKQTALSNISIVYRDPVNVTTFEQTERSAYRNILEEVNQLHVMLTGDATSSGESRIQARADFVMSLRETKAQVDAAGRWVLETALALAADLGGQPGRYAGLRVNFDCKLDPGPLSSDERRLLIEEMEKRGRSRENWMAELGIDDPAAMKTKILEEEKEFEPVKAIQVQRAQIGLQNDKLAGDTGIPSRIEEAAKTVPEVVN